MKKEIYQIATTCINKKGNYIVYDETIDIEDSVISNLKELYAFGLSEYGKCVNKVFIDRDNKQLQVGYCFEKKVKYEDCDETYIQETWLSIEHYIETIEKKYLDIE